MDTAAAAAEALIKSLLLIFIPLLLFGVMATSLRPFCLENNFHHDYSAKAKNVPLSNCLEYWDIIHRRAGGCYPMVAGWGENALPRGNVSRRGHRDRTGEKTER
jgi:hypothetical protein